MRAGMFGGSSETIFALSSAGGRAGVAVVRVSGKAARLALEKLASLKAPVPRRAQLRTLRNAQGEALDRALVLWFPAPSSYTGEDMAEFHVHGSRAVVAAVGAALGELPETRPAEAGEFTFRAFRNGKLDLAEAEGLADLLGAESEAQRRLALSHFAGEFSRQCEAWRSELIAAMAACEAEIDFPDEDLPKSLKAEAAEKCKRLGEEIRAFLGRAEAGEIVREGFHVAIIGAPNAGKSSLLNALAGREAAIVSARAGTTRDVVVVRLELEGYLVTLADTAGLQESADEIELEGMARTRREAASADMRIAVIDGTLGAAPDERVGHLLLEGDLVAINKSDLVESSCSGLRTPDNYLKISAKTGFGIDLLARRIGLAVRGRTKALGGLMPARLRHRAALKQCLDYLEKSEALEEPELVAEALRSAADALGRITGRVDVEHILDVVFKEFCIGK